MGPTDYDLPDDYEQRVEDGTMSEWYTQERARRQAMNQKTTFSKHVEREQERLRFLQRIRKYVKLGK